MKVLHNLLEPGHPKEVPDVAVVGISNWALDAAKMNRAIIVSRPDPDTRDLTRTAEAIIDDCHVRHIHPRMKRQLEDLAAAYHDYFSRQPRKDFHGLRDFYSLVKSLSNSAQNSDSWSDRDLALALMRNFGGLPKGETVQIVQEFFVPKDGPLPLELCTSIPVKELIRSNLGDRHARHLLIATEGDGALDILNDYLLEGEHVAVMCGSSLPDDCNDDYNLRCGEM